MHPLRARLLASVDIAPLAYFRIVFGITMVAEVYRFFSKGWISRYYIEPEFFFIFFGVWLTIQCLMPLRHWLYPGEVNWTEQGHNVSWHMKLRNKSGDAQFTARDPRTGERWEVDLDPLLTRRQYTKIPRTDEAMREHGGELGPCRGSWARAGEGGPHSTFFGAPAASTTRWTG